MGDMGNKNSRKNKRPTTMEVASQFGIRMDDSKFAKIKDPSKIMSMDLDNIPGKEHLFGEGIACKDSNNWFAKQHGLENTDGTSFFGKFSFVLFGFMAGVFVLAILFFLNPLNIKFIEVVRRQIP